MTKSYEGGYASHVMGLPSGEFGPPSPRYADRPSFPIPTWAKRVRIFIADAAGLPVVATVSTPGPDRHHDNTVCSGKPATIALEPDIPIRRGDTVGVAPDLGFWMTAGNCAGPIVSTPSTGTISVTFLE